MEEYDHGLFQRFISALAWTCRGKPRKPSVIRPRSEPEYPSMLGVSNALLMTFPALSRWAFQIHTIIQRNSIFRILPLSGRKMGAGEFSRYNYYASGWRFYLSPCSPNRLCGLPSLVSNGYRGLYPWG